MHRLGLILVMGIGIGTLPCFSVWSAAPTASAAQPRGTVDYQALWDDLAAADAMRAYKALWVLVNAGDPTVEELQKRMRPAPGIPPEKLSAAIADLDSTNYAAREHAMRQLGEWGRMAEPRLRKALKQQPSSEMRRRLETLLANVAARRWTPAELQQLRAVEILEYLGSPEATKLLRSLAAGAPEAPLTREARDSLERLVKQSQSP